MPAPAGLTSPIDVTNTVDPQMSGHGVLNAYFDTDTDLVIEAEAINNTLLNFSRRNLFILLSNTLFLFLCAFAIVT